MILYKITNRQNGKCYIGITSKPLRQRLTKHWYAAKYHKNPGSPLQAALRKYGLASFTIEEIARADSWDDLCRMEIEAIAQHGTMAPNGYNVTEGGEGTLGVSQPGYWLGKKRSPETVAKVRAGNLGKRMTPEQRARIREAIRGRKLSEEHKARIRAAKMGELNPQYGRARSKEERDKISAALTGRKHPPEFGNAISERLKVFHHSAKITTDTVRLIRAQSKAGRMGKDIAAELGLSNGAVSMIISGKRWGHVT